MIRKKIPDGIIGSPIKVENDSVGSDLHYRGLVVDYPNKSGNDTFEELPFFPLSYP